MKKLRWISIQYQKFKESTLRKHYTLLENLWQLLTWRSTTNSEEDLIQLMPDNPEAVTRDKDHQGLIGLMLQAEDKAVEDEWRKKMMMTSIVDLNNFIS